MALLGPSLGPGPKAVIFDLDETLLDRRGAWQYAIEQSVALVCGQRINAGGLVEEYRLRPWRHALTIVVEAGPDRARCEELCARMFERSSLKRLLVHEGMAMALDALRGESIAMGAISRERHGLALKQIQSTGLERFLTVLAATREGEWAPAERAGECLQFLERRPEECAFVSGQGDDLRAVADAGLRCFEARWAAESETGFAVVASPEELGTRLRRAWLERA